MIVYTLWHKGDDEDPPWVVDALDELTVDNNGFTDEYTKRLTDPLIRELVIDVPDDALARLFDPGAVKATVVR